MGGEAQVTVMVLKVDLGCVKCCRKIKKVLCSIPQIRNQLFDDKSNTVTVSVICCTPEKVIDKIRKKAGGTVKGIDIKPPSSQPQPPKPVVIKESAGPGPPPTSNDKPKPQQQQQPPQPVIQKPPQQAAPPPQAAEKPKSAPPPAEKPKSVPGPTPAEKPKTDEKPKSAPPPADKPKTDEKPKSAPPPADKPKSDDKPKAAAAPPPTAAGDEKSKKPDNSPPQPQQQQQVPVMMKQNQPAAFMSPELIPVAGYPSIFPPPHLMYYDQNGPYHNHQNQQPVMYSPYPQAIYQYDGYQGRPVVGDGYYGGAARSDYYTEDNPSTCSVM